MQDQWTLGRKARIAAGVGLGLVGRELYQRLREADLRGHVALITGSSRGLGFLLARELAREGCRIVICARDDQELARARERLEREGATVLAARCDVSDRAEVNGLIDEANTCFGRVDLLVNNAGLIEVGPFETMTLADFEKAMAVMFWGVVYPTFAVLPQMRARHSGRIVNITSIGGKASVPHLLPYNSAKFAAVGFSEGLHAELAPEGIQVTTIVPGLMRTGGYMNALIKGRQEKEFTWFSLSSSLPFLSMSAERAARQIVTAIKRGEAERILSLPAQILARFHGLFPSTTVELMSLANRLLPAADGAGGATDPGHQIDDRVNSRLLDTLTALGRSAARRYQRVSEPAAAEGRKPG